MPKNPALPGNKDPFRLLVWIYLCIPATAAPELSDQSALFLETHCFDCHDDITKKGGLNLMDLAFDASNHSNMAGWTRVHDRILSGEMPPPKKKRPDPLEITSFTTEAGGIVTESLTNLYHTEGRTAGRRLNPTEYEATMRDLLRTPWLEVKEILPPEPEAHGFDNVAEAQEISYIQMAQFLEAGGVAIDYAMQLTPDVAPTTKRFEFVNTPRIYGRDENKGKGSQDARILGEWIALLRQPNSAQSPYTLSSDRQREPGWYKFRIKARAALFHNGELRPPTRGHVATLYTASKRVLGRFDAPPGPEGGVVEFVAYMYENEILEIHATSLDDRIGPRIKKVPIDFPYTTDVIAFSYFETEGPYKTAECDPNAERSAGYSTLFGNLKTAPWTRESGLKAPDALHKPDLTGDKDGLEDPYRQPGNMLMVVSENPKQDAEKLIRGFLPRAYRRPVPESEVMRCLDFALGAIDDNACFQDAMRLAYKAALCSPDFLYFRESPGKLDDYAIASRLSYFIWRSMPDEILINLAKLGELSAPEILLEQLDRMLADPKSDLFVADFTNQWLELKQINDTSPDKDLYPEYFCDVLVLEGAVEEARSTFRKMISDDLPIDTVLDSNFLMINERMAALYGIEGIHGNEIREVPIPDDSIRGGLLTQAGLLKVTANGLTTSPVIRGAFVLDALLGTPPPPPPPGVGSIDPDTRGATTVREQLTKHSRDPSCASCHAHIDPPGFALENFDVMGAWRDNYRSLEKGREVGFRVALEKVKYKIGPEVDASGVSVDGDKFKDIRELRTILLEQREQIARNLLTRLITFSTSAGVTFADRPVIEGILADTKAGGYGLHSMITKLVLSETFLSK